jgi:hypothetical protein
MSVTVKGVKIAAYIDASEEGSASALSAGTQRDAWSISNNASNPTAAIQFAVGTGTALSVNVIGSQVLALSASAEEIDLKALVTLLGTKAYAKVRGLIFHNLDDAETGDDVEVGAGTTNGFTPFLGGTSPVLIVPPQGIVLLTNPQIAAWVVDSTHKTLSFDPGSGAMNFAVGIVGE